MTEILLKVDDSVFEQIIGMFGICQGVEVVSTSKVVETKALVDDCFIEALQELRENKVYKRSSDLAYIMIGANDGIIKDLPFFYSPDDFIGYCGQLGIEDIPKRSTIYNKVNDTIGKYPDWTFVGDVKRKEILRRSSIVSLFSSAYGRAKRRKLDGFLDK